MHQEFSTNDLKNWITNFTGNPELPFITTSALIELDDLQAFVDQCRKLQADCVRFYFVRFPMDQTPTAGTWTTGPVPEGCRWHEAATGLTQATIAIVPAKNFALDKEYIFIADDIDTDGRVTTLMPGIKEKGTGLNPPASAVSTKMIGR